MCRFVLCAVLLLGLTGFASADDLQLGYTVMGTGGLSAPAAGFSNSPFWWADTSGNVSGTAMANYGYAPYFNLYTSTTINYTDFQGSLLLSSAFSVNGWQPINITTTSMTDRSFDWTQLDFALLVQNSQVVAVLSDIGPNGSLYYDDFGMADKTQPSPGVTTTILNKNDGGVGTPYTLGTFQYNGSPTKNGDYNKSTEVSSSYTPVAGTYQLLFGAFGPTGSSPYQESAIAVQSISMPEEDTRMDIVISGIAFMVFGWMGWRFTRADGASIHR